MSRRACESVTARQLLWVADTLLPPNWGIFHGRAVAEDRGILGSEPATCRHRITQ